MYRKKMASQERDKPRSLRKDCFTGTRGARSHVIIAIIKYGRGLTPSTKFRINATENGTGQVYRKKMASPERDKPRSLRIMASPE